MIRRSSTLAWADLVEEPDRDGAMRSASSFTTLSFHPGTGEKLARDVNASSAVGGGGHSGAALPQQSPFRSACSTPLVPTSLASPTSSTGSGRRLSFNSSTAATRRSLDSVTATAPSHSCSELSMAVRQDSLTLASRRPGVAVGAAGGATPPQRGVISPPGSYASARPLSGSMQQTSSASSTGASTRRPLTGGHHSTASPRLTEDNTDIGHSAAAMGGLRRVSLGERPSSRGVGDFRTA